MGKKLLSQGWCWLPCKLNSYPSVFCPYFQTASLMKIRPSRQSDGITARFWNRCGGITGGAIRTTGLFEWRRRSLRLALLKTMRAGRESQPCRGDFGLTPPLEERMKKANRKVA